MLNFIVSPYADSKNKSDSPDRWSAEKHLLCTPTWYIAGGWTIEPATMGTKPNKLEGTPCIITLI